MHPTTFLNPWVVLIEENFILTCLLYYTYTYVVNNNSNVQHAIYCIANSCTALVALRSSGVWSSLTGNQNYKRDNFAIAITYNKAGVHHQKIFVFNTLHVGKASRTLQSSFLLLFWAKTCVEFNQIRAVSIKTRYLLFNSVLIFLLDWSWFKYPVLLRNNTTPSQRHDVLNFAFTGFQEFVEYSRVYFSRPQFMRASFTSNCWFLWKQKITRMYHGSNSSFRPLKIILFCKFYTKVDLK